MFANLSAHGRRKLPLLSAEALIKGFNHTLSEMTGHGLDIFKPVKKLKIGEPLYLDPPDDELRPFLKTVTGLVRCKSIQHRTHCIE